MAPLAPVLSLAKGVGAPVHLPVATVDLNCPTKYGPLVAVAGDTTLVRMTLPSRDHRALIPADGRMVLQEQIDGRDRFRSWENPAISREKRRRGQPARGSGSV